ncbi:MAG: hypothetical protein KF832_21160 [Caldilineaceae bacterium]|nr:hypothetical protein [Caldilineaceae bacterium]
MDANVQMWYAKIQELLDQKNYQEAAQLLANIELEQQITADNLRTLLLDQFPAEYFEINPDLTLVRALHALAMEQLEQATALLQRAIHFYLQQKAFDKIFECYNRLIHIYQARESFHTARIYLQEATALLDHVTTEGAQAKLALQLAELCLNINRLGEGLLYAQQALNYFRHSKHVDEYAQTLLLLTQIERQLGNYEHSETYLAMARHLPAITGQGQRIRHQLSLLNAEAHLLWYRSQFTDAISIVTRYLQLAQRYQLGKQQIYASTLLGDLYRATDQYEQSLESYNQARQLIQRYKVERYLPWLDIRESWCYLLRGDYSLARRQLQQALDLASQGQMMSFNVNLAIFYLLTDRLYIAEDLLTVSLEFYSKSGDELVIKILQWYLALIAIKRNQTVLATTLLSPIFQWMLEQNVTYFPHWWHPPLVAEICIWALETGTNPVLAERILVQQLGGKATDKLKKLEQSNNVVIQERASNILAIIQGDLHGERDIDLSYISDWRVRDTIAALLQNGQLQQQRFHELQMKLTTSTLQRRPNPVLVAIFGLYINDYPQPIIASKLGRAQTSIRNYITTIYQIFGLSHHEFPSLALRKRNLIRIAVQSGFIDAITPS